MGSFDEEAPFPEQAPGNSTGAETDATDGCLTKHAKLMVYAALSIAAVLMIASTAVVMADNDSQDKFLIAVIAIFSLFGLAVFCFYDVLVLRRQEQVIRTAKRTNKIVASLFPKDVQQRIMDEVSEAPKGGLRKRRYSPTAEPSQQPAAIFDAKGQGLSYESVYKTKPIANLFLETTIMFADLVGFTAWSSIREPTEVFTLLETIYHSFDQLAAKSGVFKVETIGDCYVAICGLPEPRKDHAVVMAKFAYDCHQTMALLMKRLEQTMGPDTGELAIRIGLHSGPVTAGVLRGDKARFQLFGDSVNTTSRVETNGARDKIHLSQATADRLKAGGKDHWFYPRNDKIKAKGKGTMQTYWIDMSKIEDCSSSTGSTDSSKLLAASSSLHSQATNNMDTADSIHLTKSTHLRNKNQDESSLNLSGHSVPSLSDF